MICKMYLKLNKKININITKILVCIIDFSQLLIAFDCASHKLTKRVYSKLFSICDIGFSIKLTINYNEIFDLISVNRT